MSENGLIKGADGKIRCKWCGTDPLYVHYHDTEWGVETKSDIALYEKICLEGFQAGLSWITILRKREAFREAFHGFDPVKVSQMTEVDVVRLLSNEGIIRHRGKIEATIHNARLTLDLIKEVGSLWDYFSRFKPPVNARPAKVTYDWLRSTPISPESTSLAKDLKKRGFKFLGPTTMYAHMQAMGLVNDHIDGCDFR
ncbi:MAG: DNA-3-methyladenine glycosylase I [Pseudobdellovibrionaceae bacterium]